ncbi:unnamed protein product [Gemmata massiliana]|uniref:Uncharacterized protein n=1 Tax=Gemmata massiliana TaxID=1210884 RepID=A0A6P2DCH1_9BACT|nr:unnamed protein product [Gemmata massiliana]
MAAVAVAPPIVKYFTNSIPPVKDVLNENELIYLCTLMGVLGSIAVQFTVQQMTRRQIRYSFAIGLSISFALIAVMINYSYRHIEKVIDPDKEGSETKRVIVGNQYSNKANMLFERLREKKQLQQGETLSHLALLSHFENRPEEVYTEQSLRDVNLVLIGLWIGLFVCVSITFSFMPKALAEPRG